MSKNNATHTALALASFLIAVLISGLGGVQAPKEWQPYIPFVLTVLAAIQGKMTKWGD